MSQAFNPHAPSNRENVSKGNVLPFYGRIETTKTLSPLSRLHQKAETIYGMATETNCVTFIIGVLKTISGKQILPCSTAEQEACWSNRNVENATEIFTEGNLRNEIFSVENPLMRFRVS